jgi:hypothetical protein
MPDVELAQAVRAALAIMQAFGAPAPAAKYLKLAGDASGATVPITALWSHLRAAPLDDPVAQDVHNALSGWDHEQAPEWAGETGPNSAERRELVYSLLKVPGPMRTVLDGRMPRYVPQEGLIKIARSSADWYDDARQKSHSHYWPAYVEYLQAVGGWHPDNIAALGRSTRAVVESLSDPTLEAAYQSKGLVMGFVQSGKTANFTGVIARAADAGYRLVIVLAGTLNILRRQTQRRLDKELVGRNAVQSWLSDDRHEYSSDAEWDDFIEHEDTRPSFYRWDRLTTLQQDYRSLGVGIAALEYPKQGDPNAPLYDPINLHRAPARLLVVKKQVNVLRALVRDLRRLGAACSEIPALIIDDESDQASLNTHKPTKTEQQRRTAINARIVELLGVLPRAQYVGYTATPFANVFVDMESAEDLFPRDFILSLETSRGYMGPRDFHDLDPDIPGTPNREARVRDIRSDDDSDPDHLPRAIDSYILSGAIKLYREAQGESVSTKHHTMLVHTSARVAEHAATAELIKKLFSHGGYSTGVAYPRLERLFVEDFRRNSSLESWGRMPDSIDDLWDFIGQAIGRVERGAGPIRVVNGENEEDTPDFDSEKVWKILVGGTKLSRGYTVEGLTTSYYRRRTAARDTLTQMGRWFGYRNGYGDLVRLFVGRAEASASRSYDLYEAFEAACVDELEFRATLRRYERQADGSRLTPRQVPPLVTNSLPWLTPTAKNKMWNAVIASRNFGDSWVERVLAPSREADIKANRRRTAQLCRGAGLAEMTLRLGDTKSEFDAFVGEVARQDFLAYLNDYIWAVPNLMDLERKFISMPASKNQIARWLIVFPQLKAIGQMGEWSDSGFPLRVVQRSRIGEEAHDRRFKAFTDPAHRAVAQFLAGNGSPNANASQDLIGLLRPRTAVALMYPVREAETDSISIGFALRFPPNALGFDISFANASPGASEAVVVTTGA